MMTEAPDEQREMDREAARDRRVRAAEQRLIAAVAELNMVVAELLGASDGIDKTDD